MNARMSELAWKTAWKIAWRDLHASLGKFAFVIVAVALGVGSLTGTRSFSVMFQRTLLQQARSLMSADLSARQFHDFTGAQIAKLDELRSQGVQHTQVIETVSMASTSVAPDPLLVSLKVVNPAKYPYYGDVQLASGRKLRQVLTGQTAIVSQEFLLRMRSHLGEVLHLGNSRFRIVDVVRSEPDRISSSFAIGPRVMITENALSATGLVRPGSRASRRMLFRLAPVDHGHLAMSVDVLRKRVETILPEAQVTDFREANPSLVDGLHRATAMLTLVSLVTMVLSAIGVAMAMHAHLQQRLETIAIMKALGARSSHVMRIYFLQTLFLGVAGALLGIGAGSLVARAFPLLLQRLISLPVEARLTLNPVLTGLLTGVLTTLLFTLPPLLEIRDFRPLRILRRNMEQDQKPGIGRIVPRDRVQIAVIVLILLALAGIASTLTASAVVGRWFAGSLLAVLVFLLLASSVAMAGVRWLLQQNRAVRSPMLRQGLANLYRPGNQSAAVLTALGVGVMLIMSVYFVQQAIVRDLNDTGSRKIPNIFLVDISLEELPGVQKLLSTLPAVHGALETIPVVSAQIASINGVPTSQLQLEHYPRRMLRSTSLTWADTLPVGEKVVSGRWWTKNSSAPDLAVTDRTAKLLHLKPGSHLVFHVGDQSIDTKVTAIYHSDGQHVFARSQFVLPSRVLVGQSAIWYGAFHADPARVGDVERTLFAAYPTVTIINVADVLETVRKIVAQIALIIRFLAAFAMLSGGIILASSVTATRFQRVREVAILKSLGALRRQIISMLSVEFLMLGVIAGAAGVLFSLVLSSILLHKLDAGFHPSSLISIAAMLITAVLASITGWLACWSILQQKPLEVLREE
ncbi:MAG TPA: FtsX-like permease family protein [Acidobacteriaceae bacterium]|nr:FtsX-like permease family protein [Acidobacteriaceae bacterium]